MICLACWSPRQIAPQACVPYTRTGRGVAKHLRLPRHEGPQQMDVPSVINNHQGRESVSRLETCTVRFQPVNTTSLLTQYSTTELRVVPSKPLDYQARYSRRMFSTHEHLESDFPRFSYFCAARSGTPVRSGELPPAQVQQHVCPREAPPGEAQVESLQGGVRTEGRGRRSVSEIGIGDWYWRSMSGAGVVGWCRRPRSEIDTGGGDRGRRLVFLDRHWYRPPEA